jgi:sugar phosphate isomerase/epimerase
MATAVVLGLWLSLCATAGAGPFFAMDTIAARGINADDGATLDAKLDDLKSMGYAGLSWTGTDVGQIKSVTAAAEKRGLKVYALYVAFPIGPKGVEVPANIDELFNAVAGHETVVWAYVQGQSMKPSDPAGDAVAIPAFRDLAERAAKRKVKVALYPHAGFWVQTVGDGLRVAKGVDRENFGICFNLCHALKTGDEKNIPDLLREARPRLFLVTINGADAGLGPKGDWDRLIQPLGRGTYDVGALLRRLKEVGYKGPIGFQGYGIKGDRREILRETMAGWKRAKGPDSREN